MSMHDCFWNRLNGAENVCKVTPFFFNYANFNAKKIITIIELFCIAQGFNELQVEKFYCRFPSLIYSVWYSSKIKHKYAYLQFNRHYLYLV